MADVRIHYLRPPDRADLFVQHLVHATEDVVITLNERTALRRPVRVDDTVILEPGAPVLWFTFPGRWHDVGRFHLADGTFTGIYANILEPVEVVGPHEWRAVDLFLDVWLGAAQPAPRLLDEDELEEALARGWLDAATGLRARAEAERLLEAARAGTWPPAIVREWTLARARAAVRATT